MEPPRQPKYEKAYGNRVQEQSSRRCRIRTAAWWGCVFCHVNEPPPGWPLLCYKPEENMTEQQKMQDLWAPSYLMSGVLGRRVLPRFVLRSRTASSSGWKRRSLRNSPAAYQPYHDSSIFHENFSHFWHTSMFKFDEFLEPAGGIFFL